MVDFLLVRIGLVVGFADTLGDNLRVTLAVAGVLAIRTLHAGSILEEFSTQCTAHNVVKLLGDELVALLLVNLLLLLANGTLTVKTNVEGTAVLQLFGYIQLAHDASFGANASWSYRSSFEAELGQPVLGQTMNRSSHSGEHLSSRHQGVHVHHVPRCLGVLRS